MPSGSYLRQVIAYSAAGRLIVQQTDRAGNTGTLLAVSESGAVTVLASGAYSAAASPDGARLAYFSGAGILYALPASGGTPVPLGVSGYALVEQLTFSPDGTLVGAAGYDSKFKALGHVAHADGSGAVRLAYRVGSLGWAPDSNRLVLAGADSKGTQGVAIVNADGTNLDVLVAATCPRPVFSPDGARIACVAFVTDPDTGSQSAELGVVSLETVLTMGPQAMEGNLRVSPGATLKVGYDFTMPGNHPSATVDFSQTQVTFQATCVSGPGGGTIIAPIASNAYIDPADSSAWYPSADARAASVYQGSIAVPDLCSGGEISLARGGTFTTLVRSTDNADPVNVRWHYSATGSSGKWSITESVIPRTS